MPLPLLRAHSHPHTCFLLSLLNISKYTTFKLITQVILSYIDQATYLTLTITKSWNLNLNQILNVFSIVAKIWMEDFWRDQLVPFHSQSLLCSIVKSAKNNILIKKSKTKLKLLAKHQVGICDQTSTGCLRQNLP